jgi:glycosyltransferase involved in cell wall biosynthesis
LSLNKKKILIISPTPSHPQNAGNRVRIFRFLDYLQKKGFEIHFLLYNKEKNANHVKIGMNLNAMRRKWDKFYYLDKGLAIFPGLYISLSKYDFIGRSVQILGLLPVRIIYSINAFLILLFGKIDIKSKILINFFSLSKEFIERIIGRFGIVLKKIYPGFHQKLRKKWVKGDNIIFLGESTAKNKGDMPANIPAEEEVYSNVEDNSYYRIDAWYDDNLNPILKYFQNKYKYEAVVCEYVFMSKSLLNFDISTIKIIDTHDVFTERNEKYKAKGIIDTFFNTTLEEEQKGLNRADKIIAIQDQEAEFFKEIVDKEIRTIGHKVRLTKPAKRNCDRYNILFVGPGNIANVQGIQHFIDHVFSKIRVKVPKSQLILVGHICKSIEKGEQIKKYGEIARIEDVYALADVVINPVIVGTGLKVKNLEALGFGKPVVTTEYGAIGLEKQMGVLTVTNDIEFEHQVLELLLNNEKYNEVAKSGFEYVRKYNEIIEEEINKLFS